MEIIEPHYALRRSEFFSGKSVHVWCFCVYSVHPKVKITVGWRI